MTGEGRRHGPIIFLVGLIQLIITTDFSLVAVTLPSIGRQLHLQPSSLSWVVSAAALTGAGLLILAGRAADIFGQRRCLLVGLVLFAAGSLAVAASPDLTWLIVARALQGCGGAILAPANFSLINTQLPEGEPRRRALGVFGVMQGLSLIIGLLIGGTLTTHIGWRWVFLLNPPIAVLAIVMTLAAVPARAKTVTAGGMDWIGAALIMAGTGLILLGVSRFGHGGGESGSAVLLLTGGLVAYGLFFVVEGHARAPLAPLSMFGRRNFTAANLILLLHLAGVGGVFVLLSLYMQSGLKMSAMQSGLGMMPYAAAVMLSGQAAPPLMARFSHRLIALVSLSLYVMGLALFAAFSAGANYWTAVALGSVVTGFGGTMAFMALMADATADIPHPQQGAASAVLFTAQQIGIPLGAAIALAGLGLTKVEGPQAFLAPYVAIGAIVAAAWLIAMTTLRPVKTGDAAITPSLIGAP